MEKRFSQRGILVFLFIAFLQLSAWNTPLIASVIVDHRHTDITVIPEDAIIQAKNRLHIAYGHTSHGSQLTTGMSGLVAFANGGGLGLSLAANIFDWNNGGSGGALDLHDYAMAGDVGYYPQWYNNTVAYLDNANNADVNVIIWSWCGQVGDKYSTGTLQSEYLTPMSQLEAAYPDVTFVYMTGHVDIWDDADNKAANQMIRNYVIANNKVLYDFADIEHYNPDGNYFKYVNDNCDYYAEAGGVPIGNWAIEWQNSHTLGVDWFECTAAHSQPLNANRKAYAAWYLWALLGGWNPSGPEAGVSILESGGSTSVIEGGGGDSYQILLSSKPADDVTITVTPDAQVNLGNGAGAAVLRTFTPANWSIMESITVTANDDVLEECNHSGIITHRVVSADGNYNGISATNVTVNISDDEKQSCMLLGIIPMLLSNQEVR